MYDDLPQRVQSRISREEAQRHDTDSIRGFRIINDATGASGPIRVKDRRALGQGGTRPSAERERREMLETIAGVVLRERWLPLTADVVKDAVENVAGGSCGHVQSVFKRNCRRWPRVRTGRNVCREAWQPW